MCVSMGKGGGGGDCLMIICVLIMVLYIGSQLACMNSLRPQFTLDPCLTAVIQQGPDGPVVHLVEKAWHKYLLQKW